MTATGSSARPRGTRDGSGQPGRLAVSVLDGIRIAYGGQEIRLANRKARALLAYLAMHETGSAQREQLAGLFWSEASERNARTSLRQVLFDLREALDKVGCPAMQASRTALSLDLDAVDLDLAAILAEVGAGRVPLALESGPHLAEMLLTGYEDLSEGFAEWLAGVRQSIQARLLQRLERAFGDETLARRQRRRLAEAALRLDPLCESACRMVMRLAAEDGETGAALRAYAALYDALGDDLDMEPSAATRELVVQIKQGHFDRPAPPLPEGTSHSADSGVSESPPTARPLVPAAPLGAPTVAVLPFREIGPDPAPRYFMDGILEETVCMLATLREPVVISSNSTRGISDEEFDPGQISRRLGAQYLVSGTVRSAGRQLRLSVELTDAASGIVLWANFYDIAEPRQLHAQDDIASSIARTLVPQLRHAELRRSRGQRPENLTVYQLMLQARELVYRLDRSAFEQAGGLLRQAVDFDPAYAPTHAALADWHSIRLGQGWSEDPAADTRALEDMARRAITLDVGSGRALAMLGHNRTILSREYDEALALFDRALEASPNDAETLMWSSPTFAYMGEPAEAARRAERAIALSPEDPFLFRYEHFLCIAHYAGGDYEAAAYWGRRSLQRNPHYTSNLRMTVAALSAMQHMQEARPLVQKVVELQPGFCVSSLLAHQPFRDDERRNLYGKHLIEAGLPE